MKCVKFILYGFIALLFLAGIGLIVAGAVVQAEFSTYLDFFGKSVNVAAILLIVVGVVIFVIGFFGCCGAQRENYCMVMTFAVFLGLIFVLEIAVGIAAYVMRDKVESVVDEKMTKLMGDYSTHESVRNSWDAVQEDFHCCGIYASRDWFNKTLYKNHGQDSVPDSCCKDLKPKCGQGNGKDENIVYIQGCKNKFVDWGKKNIYSLGGAGVGLAFVQVLGIVLACCLARTIKKEYEIV